MGYGDHRELFLWWYHARSRIYANEYLNKLLMIWDAVTKNRTDGALVRINVPVNPDIEKSLNTGLNFINSFSKLLPEYIPN
jgi:EpsI family protein